MSILQPEIIGSFLAVLGVIIALWFYLERHERRAKERKEKEKSQDYDYELADQLNEETFGHLIKRKK